MCNVLWLTLNSLTSISTEKKDWHIIDIEWTSLSKKTCTAWKRWKGIKEKGKKARKYFTNPPFSPLFFDVARYYMFSYQRMSVLYLFFRFWCYFWMLDVSLHFWIINFKPIEHPLYRIRIVSIGDKGLGDTLPDEFSKYIKLCKAEYPHQTPYKDLLCTIAGCVF